MSDVKSQLRTNAEREIIGTFHPILLHLGPSVKFSNLYSPVNLVCKGQIGEECKKVELKSTRYNWRYKPTTTLALQTMADR